MSTQRFSVRAIYHWASGWPAWLTRSGVRNLFAIAGHFVSCRWVSGPHNCLVILRNLSKAKKKTCPSTETNNKTAGLAWMLRGPHEILLRAACSSPLHKIKHYGACVRFAPRNVKKRASTPIFLPQFALKAQVFDQKEGVVHHREGVVPVVVRWVPVPLSDGKHEMNEGPHRDVELGDQTEIFVHPDACLHRRVVRLWKKTPAFDYLQGYHTVLISKIRPYLWLASLFFLFSVV